MALYRPHEFYQLGSGTIDYTVTGQSGTTETKDEREKRMTDHELAQLHRERESHKNKMDEERQEQDYNLAMMARQCVAWVMGVSIPVLLICATVVAWKCLSR